MDASFNMPIQLPSWPLDIPYSLNVIVVCICLHEQTPHRHILGRRTVLERNYVKQQPKNAAQADCLKTLSPNGKQDRLGQTKLATGKGYNSRRIPRVTELMKMTKIDERPKKTNEHIYWRKGWLMQSRKPDVKQEQAVKLNRIQQAAGKH